MKTSCPDGATVLFPDRAEAENSDGHTTTQRKLLPKLGKRVVIAAGPGRVRDVDVLSQTVRVVLDSGELVTVSPDAITPMFPSQQSGEERAEREPKCPRRRRELGETPCERRRMGRRPDGVEGGQSVDLEQEDESSGE